MIWRLIYSDNEIIDLFKTSDITISIHNIFDSNSIEDCYKKIEELKFDYEHTEDGFEYIMFNNGDRTYEIRTKK
jgi:hypothetical protein